MPAGPRCVPSSSPACQRGRGRRRPARRPCNGAPPGRTPARCRPPRDRGPAPHQQHVRRKALGVDGNGNVRVGAECTEPCGRARPPRGAPARRSGSPVRRRSSGTSSAPRVACRPSPCRRPAPARSGQQALRDLAVQQAQVALRQRAPVVDHHRNLQVRRPLADETGAKLIDPHVDAGIPAPTLLDRGAARGTGSGRRGVMT